MNNLAQENKELKEEVRVLRKRFEISKRIILLYADDKLTDEHKRQLVNAINDSIQKEIETKEVLLKGLNDSLYELKEKLKVKENTINNFIDQIRLTRQSLSSQFEETEHWKKVANKKWYQRIFNKK